MSGLGKSGHFGLDMSAEMRQKVMDRNGHQEEQRLGPRLLFIGPYHRRRIVVSTSISMTAFNNNESVYASENWRN